MGRYLKPLRFPFMEIAFTESVVSMLGVMLIFPWARYQMSACNLAKTFIACKSFVPCLFVGKVLWCSGVIP